MMDPELLARLWPEAHILDVGCGWRDLTAELARRVPLGSALGIDRELGTVVQAILKHHEQHIPNLSFRQADIRKPEDLPQASFDFVVSRACLHFLPHPGEAFPAVASALKPGGHFHSWCMGRGNAQRVREALAQASTHSEWVKQLKDYRPSWGLMGPEECEERLAQSGLAPGRCELVRQTICFPARVLFLNWVERNWGYLQRLPLHLHGPFLEVFCSHYPARDDGSYEVDLVWLFLRATRRT